MSPKEFFDTYKRMAMEQQVLYGIPASVTLAQMAQESGWGTGRAIKEGNNAFCVKGTYNGQFVLISDDKPNEKFKKYDSLQQSFDDHSKVLMGRHYAHCRAYSSTDYERWCAGLMSGESTGGKYASDKNYTSSLLKIIRTYHLDEYDRQAVEMAHSENKECGYARAGGVRVRPSAMQDPAAGQFLAGGYCMPLDKEKIEVTSLFGHRDAPTEGASTEHMGIDIRAKYEDLRSMEHGTVVAVGRQGKGGNYVMVEYERSDGHNYRVSYCHLDKDGISVEPGQEVFPGQVIARSGNTGVGTGPHLHLTVTQKNDRGKYDYVDPLDYLAEISVRGDLTNEVVKADTSNDLLADRKASADVTPTPSDALLAGQQGKAGTPALTDEQLFNARQGTLLSSLSKSNDPMEWLAYMMTQDGENGQGMSGGLSGLISTLFMGAVMLAMNLQYGDKETPAQQLERQRQEGKSEEQGNASLIHRERESADPEKLRQAASAEFEMLESSQQQSRGVRLA